MSYVRTNRAVRPSAKTANLPTSRGSSPNASRRATIGNQAMLRLRHGTGSTLAACDRARFEAGFGTGLADVRVHTGGAAADAAAMLGARAFTAGSDVAFASGQYSPSTAAGRDLLAHELGHVVQQRTARVASRGRGDVEINDDPALEHAASEASVRAAFATAIAPPSGFEATLVGESDRTDMHRPQAPRVIQRAPAPGAAEPGGSIAVRGSDDAAMRADISFLIEVLSQEIITEGDELAMLARIERWDARDRETALGLATPFLDHFLFLLKTKTFLRATTSSFWVNQQLIVFDQLWNELELDRRERFATIVSHSHQGAAGGPTSPAPENFWKTLGRQEAMGLLGLVKGLVMGATGLVDAGAGGITALLKSIPGLAQYVADAPKIAEWFGHQYDVMGRDAFAADWDGALLGSMTAGDVGMHGGQLVWSLVMIGSGTQLQAGAKGLVGATAVTPALQGAVRVEQVLTLIGRLGSIQGVRDSTIGMMDDIDRLQKGGELSVERVLADTQFLRHLSNLAGALYGALSGGGSSASGTRWAATGTGALIEASSLAVHIKTLVDIERSNDPPQVKSARFVDTSRDIIVALYHALGQLAGVKDMQKIEASAAAKPGKTVAAKPLTSAEWLAKRGTLEYREFGMKLLRRPFNETPAMERLWREASQGQQQSDAGYNAARRNFWGLVANATTDDAVLVRTVLQDAGYATPAGAAARTATTWGTSVDPQALANLDASNPYLADKVRDSAAAARTGRTPEGLQTQQRTESIEHQVPRNPKAGTPLAAQAQQYPTRFLDPANLRLENLYENMLMGNKS